MDVPDSYLENYELLSCKNLNQLRSTLSGLTSPYDLWIPKRGYEVDAFVRSASLGDLNLFYVNYGDGVPINVTAPEEAGDYLMLCFLTRGKARAQQGGNELEMTPSKGLVRDARRSIFSEQIDFSALFLTVPFARLKGHLRALLGEQADTIDPEFTPSTDLTSMAGQHMRNTLLFAARELDGPLRALNGNGGVLKSNLETLLLNQILHSLPNAHSDLLQSGRPSPALPYHVKRARDYMQAHADRPIALEALSTHAGCSIRTLQEGFRNALGSTPTAYLKSIRLDRVRQALLSAAPGDSVTALALKWGFAHHGNFAKAYRAKFGIPPSVTLRYKR